MMSRCELGYDSDEAKAESDESRNSLRGARKREAGAQTPH